MEAGEGPIWYAAVDYLRLTYTRPGAAEEALPWYQQAVARIAEEAGYLATDTRAWAWRGYAGAQAGTAAWGLREDGAILQVSGSQAERAALLDLPYTGVPRVDVQITTWGEASPEMVPRKLAAASETARQGVKHRPWKIRYIDGKGSGDTTYIGSRASAWFIRIYDKGAESGEDQYAGAIRYEVEAHDQEAERLYSLLAGHQQAYDRAARVVVGYLGARGIDLAWAVSGPVVEPCRKPREVTPTERTLNWLGEGVAPSIARLLGAGLTRDQLCGILGLG